MPWVRFTRDFDWHVPERGGRVTIAYKRGQVMLVTTPCAEAATAKGCAERAARPKTGGDRHADRRR